LDTAKLLTTYSDAPIRAEEMVYLALRSMICFHWPAPESIEDIQRAAGYEYALNAVLTNTEGGLETSHG
jgi:hypothetical protein